MERAPHKLKLNSNNDLHYFSIQHYDRYECTDNYRIFHENPNNVSDYTNPLCF